MTGMTLRLFLWSTSTLMSATRPMRTPPNRTSEPTSRPMALFSKCIRMRCVRCMNFPAPSSMIAPAAKSSASSVKTPMRVGLALRLMSQDAGLPGAPSSPRFRKRRTVALSL